jgi:hypothetical protein
MTTSVRPIEAAESLDGGETMALQFLDFDGEYIEALLHFHGGVIAWLEWYSLAIGRRLTSIPDASRIVD